DRATVLAHPELVRELGPQRRAPQVHVERLGEPRVLLLHERAERGVGAGVVDEDVDATEQLEGLLQAGAGRLLVGHVGADADRALADLGGGRLRVGLLAGGEDDVGALVAQRLGDGEADSSRRSGDDGRAALQSEVHQISLGVGWGCRSWGSRPSIGASAAAVDAASVCTTPPMPRAAAAVMFCLRSSIITASAGWMARRSRAIPWGRREGWRTPSIPEMAWASNIASRS